MVNMSIDEFRKKYPHLAKEILDGEGLYIRMKIKVKYDPWRGFQPGVIDFIRRARNEKEALEVIDYMEKKGEISPKEAEALRKQLKERGLRSFGPRKYDGYYFKEAGY